MSCYHNKALKFDSFLDPGWSPKSLDLGVNKNIDLKKLLTPKSKDLGLQTTNLFFRGIMISLRTY